VGEVHRIHPNNSLSLDGREDFIVLEYLRCDYNRPTMACKEWKIYPVSVVFFMQVAVAWQGDDVEDHEE
ncbi:MAG: hypothetical protein Q7R34_06575, partial [Dehalococcoidia bacterium]|nr:hypothetical protein [Dehalococcoidia bacterium]